jgi:hypothetical protein
VNHGNGKVIQARYFKHLVSPYCLLPNEKVSIRLDDNKSSRMTIAAIVVERSLQLWKELSGAF